MNLPLRVTLDVGIRSLALIVLSEGTARLYATAHVDDDGLGTGLTVMALLVVVSAGWGLVDGFRCTPLVLSVTWIVVGIVTAVVMTVRADVDDGAVDWTVVVADLRDGLWFWTALVCLPAIGSGIIQSLLRRPGQP